MALTAEVLGTLKKWSESISNEANKCNIKGTMFYFTEMVKKGQEVLKDGGKADDFVIVKKTYDNAIDNVITALKNTCGCKGTSDLK